MVTNWMEEYRNLALKGNMVLHGIKM